MIKKIKNTLKKHKRQILIFGGIICIFLLAFIFHYINNVNIYGDFSVEVYHEDINISDNITVKGVTFFNRELVLDYNNYQWSNSCGYFKAIEINLNIELSPMSRDLVVLFESGGKRKTLDFSNISNNDIIITDKLIDNSFSNKFTAFYEFSSKKLKIGISKVLKLLLIVILIIFSSCLIICFFILLLCSFFNKAKLKFRKLELCELVKKKRKVEFSVREIVLVLFVVVAILFTLEATSYFLLSSDKKNSLFFTKNKMVRDRYGSQAFFDIDPILGWNHGQKSLEGTNYYLTDNLILLEALYENAGNCLNILITGGSTSDIVTDTCNWPIVLQKIFEEHRICANIYVGSVDGHNSGQELFRLIVDGLNIAPDIHISYSGINDLDWSGYASQYEISNYNKLLFPERFYNYLPNLMYWLKSNNSKSPFTISERTNLEPGEFFLRNMIIMKSISDGFGYQFAGILLPVNKNAKAFSKYQKEFHFINQYNYLYSFENIFDNTDGDPFIDYCHIKHDYQHIVAMEVFKIISLYYDEHKRTL